MPSLPSGVSSGKPNPLASWDANKKAKYVQSGKVLRIHFLLDMSGSMDGGFYEQSGYKIPPAEGLMNGYNGCIALLRRHADPLSQVSVWGFNDTSTLLLNGDLGTIPRLTSERYQPEGGTRLAWALEQIVNTTLPGEQLIVVLTDGMDTDDNPVQATRTREALTKRIVDGWLCVYLGAFQEALAQGLAYGFHPGNCLVFDVYGMAQAFKALEVGLQKFLQAGQAERKLLTTGGIFV